MEKNSSQSALGSKTCSPMAASARLGLSCHSLSFTLLIPLCTDLELLHLSCKPVQESDLTGKDFYSNWIFVVGGDWGGLFVLVLVFFCLGFVDLFIILFLSFCFWVFL